jgi:hypothetical protein
VASIMLHGRIVRTGPPGEIGDELAAAYLGSTGPASVISSQGAP